VAFVSGQLHLVIFNDILFNDGVSFAGALSVSHSSGVDVCPWDEAIVARDVAGGLGGANSEVVEFIFLLGVSQIQLVSGVLAVGAVGDVVLSLEEAPLRGVGLSGQTPKGSGRSVGWLRQSFLNYALVGGLPVGGGSSQLGSILISNTLGTASLAHTGGLGLAPEANSGGSCVAEGLCVGTGWG